jgi:MFS family permease
VLHSIPLLTDAGFSSSRAAFLFGLQAWSALISKPIWGALMQRIHARVLSAWSLVGVGLATIAILLAARNGSTLLVALAFLSYGLAVGGNAPLQETVWGAYIGRTHIGKIRALAMPFTILFGAGGPWVAGTLYDQTGDYVIAYMIFGIFSIIGCVLIVAARPPSHPSTRPGIMVTPDVITPAPVPAAAPEVAPAPAPAVPPEVAPGPAAAG